MSIRQNNMLIWELDVNVEPGLRFGGFPAGSKWSD